jgi:hypothetical protein
MPRAWDRLASIVAWLSALVLDRSWLFLAGALTIVTLVKNGFALFPQLGLEMAIAQSFPFRPADLPVKGDYFMSSVLGPGLVHALGLQGRISTYLLVHAAVFVISVVALVWTVRRRYSDRAARLVAMLLATSSVPLILLQWFGVYDIFTFALGTFLAVVEAWPLVIALSVALSFAHFEQGLVIVVLLVLVKASRRWNRWQLVGMMGGGLFVGKLASIAYLSSIGMSPFSGTAGVAQTGLGSGETLGMALQSLPTVLYSLLGPAWLWLLVVAFVLGRGWSDRRYLIAAFLLPVLFSLITLDHTRVYAMVTAPLIVWLAIVLDDRCGREELDLLASTAVLSLFVSPALFVWEGRTYVPKYTDVFRLP